jgi:hypothetical protein
MSHERNAVVTAIAGSFVLAAIYLLAIGVFLLRGDVSLSAGAFLLEGLQLMGPGIFFLIGTTFAIVAVGLWFRQNWARRAASLLSLALVVGAVPPVSSAVIDFRFADMAREGAKVLAGVAVWFYLMQPGTRQFFGQAVDTPLPVTPRQSE